MKKYEVFITQNMIDEGSKNLWDDKSCIGAKALQSLEELKNDNPKWYFTIGETNSKYFKAMNDNGDLVKVMDITEPQKVYFQEITKKEFNSILFSS